MGYPRVTIDLYKIKSNIEILKSRCEERGISLMGITKSFCAEREIVKCFERAEVKYVGDSRLENLQKIEGEKLQRVLIRLPMLSEVRRAVEIADITFNTEYETIEKLNEEAEKLQRKHSVLLLVEMGDLREGTAPEHMEALLEKVLKLENIEVIGIGANFSCYGGIIPDEEKFLELSELAKNLEEKFEIKFKMVSGGNSSSLYLLERGEFFRIDNLRIGEGIVLGRETAFGTKIQGCYQDAFILEGEIIEIKEKQSIPKGKLGVNAFGERPRIEDLGVRKRAILALGRQDVEYTDMTPLDKKIRILGASSDHLILDITDSEVRYRLGDKVSFILGYGSLTRAMSSSYVYKVFKEEK